MTDYYATDFDPSTETKLPAVRHGYRLRRIRFRTCPGARLHLEVVHDVSPDLDAGGVPMRSWWACVAPDQPVGCFQIFSGATTMYDLLKRYGFQDRSGCLHHRYAVLIYLPASQPLPESRRLLDAVPKNLRDAGGIQQFTERSGICWFSSVCWCLFANPEMHAFSCPYFPEDLQGHAKQCFHDNRRASELRDALWYRYGLGDDVRLGPENDGQNGGAVCAKLCERLKIPHVVYRVNESTVVRESANVTSDDAPHLVLLRFQDADHERQFPIRRVHNIEGKRCKLVAIMLGQRQCGHQEAFANVGTHGDTWAHSDTDMHKLFVDGKLRRNVGPTFFKMDRNHLRDFAGTLKYILPVTKWGKGNAKLCNFSVSQPNDALQRFEQPDKREQGELAFGSLAMPVHGRCSLTIDLFLFASPKRRAAPP